MSSSLGVGMGVAQEPRPSSLSYPGPRGLILLLTPLLGRGFLSALAHLGTVSTSLNLATPTKACWEGEGMAGSCLQGPNGLDGI